MSGIGLLVLIIVAASLVSARRAGRSWEDIVACLGGAGLLLAVLGGGSVLACWLLFGVLGGSEDWTIALMVPFIAGIPVTLIVLVLALGGKPGVGGPDRERLVNDYLAEVEAEGRRQRR